MASDLADLVKRNRRRVLLVIIALVMTMVVTGAPSSIAASNEDDSARSDRLLEQISETNAVPVDRLESVDETVWEFTHTGKTVFAVKAMDRATGKVYLAAVDQDGNEVDLTAEMTADDEARLAKSGRVDSQLEEELTGKKGNERLRVSIWVDDPNPLVVERPGNSTQMSRQAAEDFLEEHLERVAAHNAKVREGVVKAIAKMNARAIEPQYSPVVFADLNRGQIQRLSKRNDISMIYGPQEYTKFEDDATTTQRAFPTHYGQNFGDSNAARPVIHEDDGVADFNPYLDNDTHPVIYWCSNVTTQCPSGKNIGNHATEVAGVIGADNGLTNNLFPANLLQRGMAPGVPVLLSANSQDLNSDSQNVAAFEWAVGNKGVPINMSWGTICFSGQTFSSRYVDWAIRNLFATTVISSGNTHPACSGNPEDLRVSSPGHAWGAITVGAHTDGNTGFHDDDVMAGFPRWQTPNFAGAPTLKPEVVAVGVGVTTTDAAGGDHLTPSGVNGTSFSAPQVSGAVALILRRSSPEAWSRTLPSVR